MPESDFPGDETFEQETGYPEDDPLGLEGGPPFEGGPEAEDPFAEVPPVAAAVAEEDDLPPGVEAGSLGGLNPSEMTPIDPEAEPPYEPGAAPEPGPGDIADDDPVPGVDPLAPEDVGLGDEPPAPAEAELLAEDSAAAAEAEPDPRAELGGGEEAGEGDQSGASDRPPTAGGQVITQPESGDQEPAPEPDPEPDKPASKPRKRRRTKGPKLQPGQREYTILRSVTVDGFDKPLWEEALSSPVVARSGELALRKAFRILSENKPGTFELVPVPTKYWNPEPVEGEVPDAALAIKVGGKKK